MKKRIRKTGEIVDVIAYSGCHSRMNDDYVSYIDSKGEEHQAVRGLNYYLDFEDVEEEPALSETDIDWEERRYSIAKKFMSFILGRANYDPLSAPMMCCSVSEEKANPYEYVASMSVQAADALIAELKKGGNNE